MKKNNMFFMLLSFSMLLHGVILFGASQKNSRTSSALSAKRHTSTVKIIKTKRAQPQKRVEKKAAEKTKEAQPEAVREEDDTEAQSAEDEGEISESEYNELLAYIKKFIDRNLVYPPIARQRNVEGVAGVSFVIDSSGKIVSIALKSSSGSSILDNAAVSLIKKMGQIKTRTIKNKVVLNINVDYKLTE